MAFARKAATLAWSGTVRRCTSARSPVGKRAASALAFVEQSRTARFDTLYQSTPYTPPERRDAGVGILAAEVYMPTRFVAQDQLEVADSVGAGKYTVGLGQSRLAFVDDREDINTICMNAVQRLMDNYGIRPEQVGRIDVGTESLVDKSKSTKTTLVGHLFGDQRNIEGVTTINACYGGTAALLNSVAWVESSDWDGRYAIYVTGDIAVYERGPARPTGGVGAVAVLVGPDAPLRMIPGSRYSHTSDVDDFFKPSLMSEYPVVDGHLSLACYLRAVDDCYNGAMRRMEAEMQASDAIPGADARPLTVSSNNYWLFHSPYNKLVQQSYSRLLFNDAMVLLERGMELPAHLEALRPWADAEYEDTLRDRNLAKTLATIAREGYDRQVAPSVDFSKNIGNSYAAAVHANIVSLVSQERAALEDKRLGVFSYGSGAIATMFGLRGARPTGPSTEFTLDRMADTINLAERLAERRGADVGEFEEAMLMREDAYGKADCTPVGSLEHVREGDWYLADVDSNYHRHYVRKE